VCSVFIFALAYIEWSGQVVIQSQNYIQPWTKKKYKK